MARNARNMRVMLQSNAWHDATNTLRCLSQSRNVSQQVTLYKARCTDHTFIPGVVVDLLLIDTYIGGSESNVQEP